MPSATLTAPLSPSLFSDHTHTSPHTSRIIGNNKQPQKHTNMLVQPATILAHARCASQYPPASSKSCNRVQAVIASATLTAPSSPIQFPSQAHIATNTHDVTHHRAAHRTKAKHPVSACQQRRLTHTHRVPHPLHLTTDLPSSKSSVECKPSSPQRDSRLPRTSFGYLRHIGVVD